ncbi:MAG: T9SS type A sorting domain-containing protein [Bacteroidetes bacterium]|nr:T9SS type A sorting domain-containing protein [Bacteroidota bacterium]MBL0064661.1 T9SS type A sorting domain-containing protein [Bacteroidota bacterium]
MKTLLLSFWFYLFCNIIYSQAPAIQWKKCFGGSNDDIGFAIRESLTGGYYIAGHTQSHNGDVHHNNGFGNLWLFKIDYNGNLIWEKSYGGSFGHDAANNMQITADGGIIMVGEASSQDGDVIGLHGSNSDIWVVKTDSSGNLLWQKCLGGGNDEVGNEIKETKDGGYILIGTENSLSGDGDISFSHRPPDAWVVKLDSVGNLLWEKTLGGYDGDFGVSVVEGDTNEFYFATDSQSNDSLLNSNHGGEDVLITKLDANQNIVWQKCFGGSNGDVPAKIYFDLNSRLNIGATTGSNDFDIPNFSGAYDAWLFTIDSTNLVLSHCFGGPAYEELFSISPTIDSGTLLCGSSNSFVSQFTCYNTFLGDFFILKSNSAGMYEWNVCIGGSGNDVAHDAIETSDGSYIAVGSTESSDYDVVGNHGGKDVWVVKLSPPGVNVPELEAGVSDFTAYENSGGAIQLEFNAELASELKLSLFDLTGRCVLKENFDCIAGMNTHRTPSFSPAPGIYVLTLADAKGAMVKKVFVNGGK